MLIKLSNSVLLKSSLCLWFHLSFVSDPPQRRNLMDPVHSQVSLHLYIQPGFLISVCMFRLLHYGFVYMTPYTYCGYMHTYVYANGIYTKRNTGMHLRYRYRWNRDIQTYEKLTSHPSVTRQGLWRNPELVNWLDCLASIWDYSGEPLYMWVLGIWT